MATTSLRCHSSLRCHWTKEPLVAVEDGYGGEWIPAGFIEIYHKIKEHILVKRSLMSFYDNPQIQQEYQAKLDKLEADIDELLTAAPRYKPRAKAMMWR